MSVAARAWIVLAAIGLWLVTACFLLSESLLSWGWQAGAGLGDFLLGLGVLTRYVVDAFSWLPWAGALFCLAALVTTWFAARSPK